MGWRLSQGLHVLHWLEHSECCSEPVGLCWDITHCRNSRKVHCPLLHTYKTRATVNSEINKHVYNLTWFFALPVWTSHLCICIQTSISTDLNKYLASPVPSSNTIYQFPCDSRTPLPRTLTEPYTYPMPKTGNPSLSTWQRLWFNSLWSIPLPSRLTVLFCIKWFNDTEPYWAGHPVNFIAEIWVQYSQKFTSTSRNIIIRNTC